MNHQENNECIPCSSTPCPDKICADKNYNDVNCITTYPFRCSIWTGEPIECLGIQNGDNGSLVISKIMSAVCNSIINSPDNLFRISVTDTTSGYFQSKILAGTGIILTKNNASENETITISVDDALNVPLVVNSNDFSITYSQSGTLNHTLDLGVHISTDADNMLSKRSSGLFSADTYTSKISSLDTTADFLNNKIVAGNNISITKLNAGSNELLQISCNSVGLVNVSTISTNSVAVFGIGTPSNPLSFHVKLSTNSLNLITKDSTGLLVLNSDSYSIKTNNIDASSGFLEDKLLAGTLITFEEVNLGEDILALRINNTETPIIVTDSSTINFTPSGSYNHSITAAVKISASSYNLISAQLDGIYVGLLGNGLVNSTSGVITYVTDNSTNWNTTYSQRISSLTTIGSSGSSTLISNVLNVPTYTLSGLGGLSSTRSLTINGITYDLSADRTWTLTTSIINEGSNLYYTQTRFNNAFALKSTSDLVEGTNLYYTDARTRAALSAGTAISYNSTSGAITNTAPDQTVVLTSGTGINVTGTYPNFTITNSGISGISGTTNYHAKFTSSSAIGNSLIYDTGSAISINSISSVGLFNVYGTTYISNTHTYVSGTEYALGVSNTATFTGTLTASNASMSTIPLEFTPTFNGNTSVSGDTPFGAILANVRTVFISTGTVTMNNGTGGGTKSVSSIIGGTYDNSTINGTISKSSVIQINGIYNVPGSVGIVTRTDHYMLLINSSNEFSGGSNITNKWGIYQLGTTDTNRFFGVVQNAGGTTQFTSDKRIKENIVDFTRGLTEIEQISTHKFNYIYNKGVQVTGIIAQELEQIIPEAISQGKFELPDGSVSYSDFRMVDQNVLFYAMLNAIKELSAKVKTLEGK